MKPIKFNKNVLIISSIYLSLIFSQGTQNTRYFQIWIEGIVRGDFFSLYHVIPNVGVLKTVNLTVPYPPFSLYLLGLTAKLLILIGGEFHTVFLISSNLTSVIFTLTTYLLLALWGKKRGNLSPIWYLLTPAVFLISPILGYQDSIMSFFILGALIAAEKDRYLLVGIFAAFAIFSKQLALMPMFGLGLLILLTAQWHKIFRTLAGFAITTILILSPFIATNTLAAYFHAQGLASVHTMMSAQNPNIPWLISLVNRMISHGLFNMESYSAIPYEIGNQALRQKTYLSFALITISIIVTYLLIWSQKIGLQQISPLHIGSVSISTYNLFSFGVHENHVFMLIPVLFAITNDIRHRNVYLATSAALAMNLLATGGLGQTFTFIPILAVTNGLIYSTLSVICLALYSWSFYILLSSNPQKQSNPGS